MLFLSVAVLRSSLSPAVSLLIIIKTKRATPVRVISRGCLNHAPKQEVVRGKSAKPIAIPNGRLLLGAPPNLRRWLKS